MGKYTIQPLKLGTAIRDYSILAYMYKPGIQNTVPYVAWYLTDGVHKVLVDTGGEQADGIHHMPYFNGPGENIIDALAAIGVKPEDITEVFFTHLHWDHASNNRFFTNAKFYVQKKELEFAADPLPTQKNVYNKELIFQTEYEILDGDVENVIDGISVITTPGHTEGSQTVLVDTEKGIYGITGDLINGWFCWEAEPKLIGGIHTDIRSYLDSYAKVEKACDFVFPGHDMRIFDQKIYP